MKSNRISRMILSLGMGVDSAAILLRWLTDPNSRDFELADLTVITCMVGDEYPSTYRLMREHVVPRLQAAGVRFVQVARAGFRDQDGIVVLDDSTSPTDLHECGPVRYSDELRGAVTIQTMSNRRCTLKWKGWPLDKWIEAEVGDEPYLHAIGFAKGEEKRVEKDQNFGGVGNRTAVYPLIEWGWDRAQCEAFLLDLVGESWKKSCCTYCPFQGGCKSGLVDVVARWRDEPEAAGQALELEALALAFNPKMKLFKTKSARELLEQDGNLAAIRAGKAQMDTSEWAVYLLRRAHGAGQLHTDECPNHKANRKARTKKAACECSEHETVKGLGGRCKRDVREVFKGSQNACRAKLGELAAHHNAAVGGDGAQLVTKRALFPTRESTLVVAPRVLKQKNARHVNAFEKLYATCKAADDTLAKEAA